jgi:transposase
MRKQINGLAVIVEESMGGQPLSGNLFLFCNRRRTHLKVLYWDSNGFALWLKRLERERFPWPEGEAQAREISVEELRMLLAGIDFWKAHRKLEYTRVR